MKLEQFIKPGTNDRLAIYNQFGNTDELLFPFAIDDTILTLLNKGDMDYSAVLHFWPTDPAVFLGMVDTKLANLAAAARFLNESNFTPIIRPAGGLAVVSGPGIINFTLLINADDRIKIDDGFEIMVELLNRVVAPFGFVVETGEIETSYCPGKYDVSINGTKIAGLAQRRIGNAVGVYVYLSLTGPQMERGELIREFYKIGEAEKDERQRFPVVDPQSMSNIDKFIPAFADEETFKKALIKALIGDNQDQFVSKDLADLEFESALEKMKQRNKEINTFITKA